MMDKIWHWFVIRGSIGLLVFILSTAFSAVMPGFLAPKVLAFCFGWIGGRVARYIESRATGG
jgi:hypothetical protein